jgi:hypothetical protein
MIKLLARLICVLFFITLAANGMAQSKTKPKSQPAKPAKSAAKPVEKKEEVKEDMGPPIVEELEPTVDTAVPVTMSLPPLPEIDTIPAPNDDLTQEIKKLLQVTGAMNTATIVMKGAIESQRKMNTSLPDEFYTRMLQKVENGTVSGYIENSVVKIYRKKFTIDEIREVIKFYDSPIGKKMAAEAGPIANASRVEGEKVGQYVAIKIIEGLMKEGKWK